MCVADSVIVWLMIITLFRVSESSRECLVASHPSVSTFICSHLHVAVLVLLTGWFGKHGGQNLNVNTQMGKASRIVYPVALPMVCGTLLGLLQTVVDEKANRRNLGMSSCVNKRIASPRPKSRL